MSCSVAVVGSANLDLVTSLDRFPAPGETVRGQGLVEVAGGKGLNQALAAARRVPTALVGCVGRDPAGELVLRRLSSSGVDHARVRSSEHPTGRALIQVLGNGENSIVVVPLANEDLRPEWVEESLRALEPDVVLCQLEVPLAAVAAAVRWTQQQGARFVLNASPVMSLPDNLLRACDPLVVNAGEATAVLSRTGRTPSGRPASVGRLTEALMPLVGSVVVTDGPRGCYLAGPATSTVHVRGEAVSVTDTTGAGDEFAGALAGELSSGTPLEAAAAVANAAAATIVQLARTAR